MTTLVFLLAIALVVGTIVAIEGDNPIQLRRPSGLLQWLVSGNWPAKIGATLIVVGTGALLRYAAINIDVAPAWKIAAGIMIAAALGFGSVATRSAPKHRTLSLVLGGAACGVAYLTAYSTFALHGYLDSTLGLGLLALTAIIAGVFAVNRGALSVGVLAMVGAYLAPILSQGDPGPYIVYGYYAAISALTLAMVAARGWRPLIHLSFLFTLVSGVFFAWNAQYYSPAYFREMAPMLALLAGLHVAMPIVAQRNIQSVWVERVDYVYLLALPVVTTLLAVAISPSRAALALQLIVFGVIWLAAAAYLRSAKREGAAAHAVIGTLLLGFGMAARFRGAPWDVITLAASVGALAISVYSSQSRRLHDNLVGIVLVIGAAHALTSIGARGEIVFLNIGFIERLIAAALLIYAGVLARKARLSGDALLMYSGIGWAVLNLVSEFIRWDIFSLALTLHWLAIVAALVASVFSARLQKVRTWAIVIPIAIVVTASSAAGAAPTITAMISLAAAITALLAFSLRPHDPETNAVDRIAAVIFVPVVTVLWAQPIGNMPLSVSLSAVLAMFAGSFARQRSDRWFPITAPIFGVAFMIALASATTVSIERDALAVLTELACLAGLVTIALDKRVSGELMPWVRPATVIALALFIQANMLRWLGPDGHLDVSAITRMQWPALLSLVWAATGSALTMWSRVNGSRTLWSGGAALLVAAAVKLALVDLGALGDLTNILAVIGAGGVFLLVGWLAPIPPAIKEENAVETVRDRSGEKIGWSIAIVVSIVLLLSRHGTRVDEVLDQVDPDNTQSSMYQSAPPAAVTPPASQETEPTPQTLDTSDQPPVEPQSAPDTAGANPDVEAPSTPETADANVEVDTECSRFAAKLPADYDVYVAGALQGRPLDVAVGGSRELSGVFDVEVHAPDRPVVLVLAARQSALWMIRPGSETNIAGVWLAGDGKHRAIGVPSTVPVMKGPEAERDCGTLQVSNRNSQEVRDTVLRVFGREPKELILASEGDITIGRAPAPAREPHVETSRNDSVPPLPGDRGIEQLLREGKLKRATVADYNRWVGRDRPRVFSGASSGTYLWRTYLVTGPITFPSGLHGAHLATFILLPGVPHPNGDPGHSQVIQGK